MGSSAVGLQQLLKMQGFKWGDPPNEYHAWFDGDKLFVDGRIHSLKDPYDVRSWGATGDGVTDDTATIHAARDAAGDNGTLYFGHGTYIVNGLNATHQGQTWILHQDAIIQQAASGNGSALSISGTDTVILGGIFKGNAANQTSGNTIGISGDRTTILHAIIQDGYQYCVYGLGASKVRIAHCRLAMANNVAQNHALFAEKGCDDWNVANNVIAVTANNGHAVAFHATTGGLTVNRPRVTDNYLETLQGFGVEIGDFGGNTSVGAVVSGNVIVATGAGDGGISMSGCSDATVGVNSYTNNGQIIGIAGIELVKCDRVTAQGNTIIGGTGLQAGITLNESRWCSVAGNVINGFITGASGYGIQFYTQGVYARDVSYNVVANNVIQLPDAANTACTGILMQTNASGYHANNNSILGNTITNASGNGRGIHLLNSAGSISYTLVQMNQMAGMYASYDAVGAASGNVANNIAS